MNCKLLIGVLIFFTSCIKYKNLNMYPKQTIQLTVKSDPLLYYTFSQKRDEVLINLDKEIQVKYNYNKSCQQKWGFLTPYYFTIGKSGYTLNLSNRIPLVYRNGIIFMHHEYNPDYKKDTISIDLIQLNPLDLISNQAK